RPGGKWRIVHRGPDGDEDGFHGEFREIVRPERIVWTFEWEGMPGHVSVDTLTLEEHEGKTTVIATSAFDSVEDRDGMLGSGLESGAAESYDRLDEYLEVLRERSVGGGPYGGFRALERRTYSPPGWWPAGAAGPMP